MDWSFIFHRCHKQQNTAMNESNHNKTAIHDEDDMAVINFIHHTIIALIDDNDDKEALINKFS